MCTVCGPATRHLCSGNIAMLSVFFLFQDKVLLCSSDSFVTGGNVAVQMYMQL